MTVTKRLTPQELGQEPELPQPMQTKPVVLIQRLAIDVNRLAIRVAALEKNLHRVNALDKTLHRLIKLIEGGKR